MTQILKHILFASSSIIFSIGMIACEEKRVISDGPVEEKAEELNDKMENVSDDTKDKIEEAGETIDDAVEK